MKRSSKRRARRRIFVGDIQGCAAELERLLERLRFDPSADELHPVGDFVNRGPDSAGVLRLMRAVDAGGVLGNHDLHLMRVAAGLDRLRQKDTIRDVLDAPDREKLLAWLAARPLVRAWRDVLLVHAGVHPRWTDPARMLTRLDPLAGSSQARFALTVRYCTGRGALPADDRTDPGPPFKPWFHQPLAGVRKGQTVVFGHWASRGLVVEPSIRGLDTGCVWGGRLTAWIAEEDRLVQVEARRAYARPRG